jgi:hypothetical protein
MRPGISRFALGALLGLAGLAGALTPLSAEPGRGGFSAIGRHAGAASPLGAAIGRDDRGPRRGAFLGSRFRDRDAALRGHGRHGRFGSRYRHHGPLIGYGYGVGWWGGAPMPLVPEPQTVKLEWPTSIGIPPSPVQPPALYVIGAAPKRAAVAPRLRLRQGAARAGTSAGSGRFASGPVFIPVPGAR